MSIWGIAAESITSRNIRVSKAKSEPVSQVTSLEIFYSIIESLLYSFQQSSVYDRISYNVSTKMTNFVYYDYYNLLKQTGQLTRWFSILTF